MGLQSRAAVGLLKESLPPANLSLRQNQPDRLNRAGCRPSGGRSPGGRLAHSLRQHQRFLPSQGSSNDRFQLAPWPYAHANLRALNLSTASITSQPASQKMLEGQHTSIGKVAHVDVITNRRAVGSVIVTSKNLYRMPPGSIV